MKKKSYIILILILAIIVIGLGIFVYLNSTKESQNQKSEELLKAEEYFIVDLNKDKTEYIIKGLKKNKNTQGSTIVIPDSIDNIPVTKIIDSTNDFACFNNVSVIKLGANINYIGKNAYIINENYPYGENIFLNALSLVSIDVNSNNQTYASVDGVLYNKELTTLLKFPVAKTNSQKSYSYTVLDSVTTIYQSAFKYNKMVEIINIPDSVTNIESSAFYSMENLYTINLGKNVLEIGKEAFVNCNNLNVVNLPENLKILHNGIFQRCDKLTEIYINSNLETVGVNLFTGSHSLKYVYVLEEYKDNLVTLFKESKLNIDLIKTQ